MTEVAVLVLGSWYADGVGLLALERARLELWITHTRDMRWRGHRLCLVSRERYAGHDVHQLCCGVRHSHATIIDIILNPLNTLRYAFRPRPTKEICSSRYGFLWWVAFRPGCLKGVLSDHQYNRNVSGNCQDALCGGIIPEKTAVPASRFRVVHRRLQSPSV